MFDYSDIIVALGAVVLFSVIAINANRMLANHNRQFVEGDLEYTAIAKAQEIIDQAQSLAFDETTTGRTKPVSIPEDFTDPENLGTAFDSDSTGFDDFDDFHSYAVTETTAQGVYNISTRVVYVTESNPGTSAGQETGNKHLTVSVSSPYLPDSINVSCIKTHY